MNNSGKTRQFAYDNHDTEWDKVLNDAERRLVGETWLRDDTLDSWRHKRMRDPVKPLVFMDEGARWLTIGDGRFGSDAHYLLSLGASNVHCSDISDTLLKVGKEKGFINAFSVQNAEAIEFPDNSFDFVYCKEAFHHCPRSYIALHEMFRVAKKAVVMTEPWDDVIEPAPFSILLRFAKSFLGLRHSEHGFESVGNYVYSISPREVEKFLLGMHYSIVAFFSANDAYFPGIEFVNLKSRSPRDLFIKLKLKARIFMLDVLCWLGIKRPSMLMAILFKEKPTSQLLASLKSHGWRIKELPKNPYL
jgi:ubiquinone/menaquinone biosynthesis C-methylase UbiE